MLIQNLRGSWKTFTFLFDFLNICFWCQHISLFLLKVNPNLLSSQPSKFTFHIFFWQQRLKYHYQLLSVVSDFLRSTKNENIFILQFSFASKFSPQEVGNRINWRRLKRFVKLSQKYYLTYSYKTSYNQSLDCMSASRVSD